MKRLAMLLLFLLATPESLFAAEARPAPGARVRITPPGSGSTAFTATLVRLEPDRLVFRRDDGTEASVTPAEVLVLEQHGTRSRAGMGALIGLGIGLTAGAAIAALGPGSNTDGVFDSGRMNLGVALASGGLGALTGAGVGAFVREDRWSSVPGWDRRMAITTSEPVVGVQLTWRW